MGLFGVQNNPYEKYGQYGKVPFGSLTAPKVGAPAPTEGTTGIAIPQNHSYTTDTDGSKVAMGQDGVGLAHRNKEDYGFMLIA